MIISIYTSAFLKLFGIPLFVDVYYIMRNIEDCVTIGEGMHSNESDVTRRERTLYIIYYLIYII